jgi:hypothetical protein
MTKRYRKIKQRQRAHLDSMEKKCDITRRRDNVDRMRGDIGEGKRRRLCNILNFINQINFINI